MKRLQMERLRLEMKRLEAGKGKADGKFGLNAGWNSYPPFGGDDGLHSERLELEKV